jgi:hypothetical protein
MAAVKLRPFEEEIAADFRLSGKAASPKGRWIQGYLLTYGRGNPYSMWKAYQQFAAALGINPGTYNSFKTYMWILTRKKLNLIRVVTKVRGKGFGKTYYAIRRGMEDSPLWKHPMQVAYPKTDWKAKSLDEKRALRRRYRK